MCLIGRERKPLLVVLACLLAFVDTVMMTRLFER